MTQRHVKDESRVMGFICSPGQRSPVADRLRPPHCARAQKMVLLLATRRLQALELNTIGLPIGLELPVQRDEDWRAVRVREYDLSSGLVYTGGTHASVPVVHTASDTQHAS